MFKRTLQQLPRRQFLIRGFVTAGTRVPRIVTAPAVVRQLQWRGTTGQLGLRSYSSEAEKKEKREKEEKEEKEKEEEKKEKKEEKKEKKEELEAELEEVRKDAKEYKDKFIRTVAEFRNLQDRTVREVKAAKDYALQKFAKDLVDSVDNLDRALSAVPEAARVDVENKKELVDLYNGLKMTEKILLQVLQKHGLEKVDPMGELFDPNRHEAMFQVPMPDKEPNTVVNVQQTGFVLNGRTIRAAKVGVAAPPR